jgi:hypothetical protein
VEWPAESGMAGQLLTWMRLRGSDDEGKPQAEQLMADMRSGAATALPAIRLQELNDITSADLDEFCDVMKLSDAQKTWLRSRITQRRPRTSREVFQAIDDYLPDARSVT